MGSIPKSPKTGNMDFRQFIEAVNESQIDMLYNKAKIAVKLAEMYEPSDRRNPSGADLLRNISTIASLASNAYGVYIPRENRKLLPDPIKQDLIHRGKVDTNNLDAIPRMTLLRYLQSTYPPQTVNQLNNQIKNTDTIHVNIQKILQQHPDDISRIIEIAKTVLHEARHEWERENYGTTSEVGPEAVEKDFESWMQRRGMQYLTQTMKQYPQQQSSQSALPGQPQPSFPIQSAP